MPKNRRRKPLWIIAGDKDVSSRWFSPGGGLAFVERAALDKMDMVDMGDYSGTLITGPRNSASATGDNTLSRARALRRTQDKNSPSAASSAVPVSPVSPRVNVASGERAATPATASAAPAVAGNPATPPAGTGRPETIRPRAESARVRIPSDSSLDADAKPGKGYSPAERAEKLGTAAVDILDGKRKESETRKAIADQSDWWEREGNSLPDLMAECDSLEEMLAIADGLTQRQRDYMRGMLRRFINILNEGIKEGRDTNLTKEKREKHFSTLNKLHLALSAVTHDEDFNRAYDVYNRKREAALGEVEKSEKDEQRRNKLLNEFLSEPRKELEHAIAYEKRIPEHIRQADKRQLEKAGARFMDDDFIREAEYLMDGIDNCVNLRQREAMVKQLLTRVAEAAGLDYIRVDFHDGLEQGGFAYAYPDGTIKMDRNWIFDGATTFDYEKLFTTFFEEAVHLQQNRYQRSFNPANRELWKEMNPHKMKYLNWWEAGTHRGHEAVYTKQPTEHHAKHMAGKLTEALFSRVKKRPVYKIVRPS